LAVGQDDVEFPVGAEPQPPSLVVDAVVVLVAQGGRRLQPLSMYEGSRLDTPPRFEGDDVFSELRDQVGR
jgi:hypothetical protein